MSYKQKLKDPRWQKKRLKILNRDGWKCRVCGDRENTLAVHHLVENKDRPWDSKDDHLLTLCKNCHIDESYRGQILVNKAILKLRDFGVTNIHLYFFLMVFKYLGSYGPDVIIDYFFNPENLLKLKIDIEGYNGSQN